MTLLIREDDVRQMLTMSDAVQALQTALLGQATQGGANLSRRRAPLAAGVLNVMAASVPSSNSVGVKAYTAGPHGARFIAALWDRDDGDLLAILEADLLGRIRTGAASGVATDALAPADARVMTIVGAGRQAITQVEAVITVRALDTVYVCSRSSESRDALARDIRERLDVDAVPSGSVADAVSKSSIVTTITSSAKPVIMSSWLPERCHINAAGANHLGRRELDSAILARANRVVVDSREQAEIESSDLSVPIEEGKLEWYQVEELGEVLAKDGNPGSHGITVFKSLGIAVEDVAVARLVYERACQAGLGEESTFGEGRV